MDANQPKIKTMKAVGTWSPPVKVSMRVGEFDGIVMDQPEAVGGTNLAPGPMEYVTAALVGCAGQTLAFVARQMDFYYASAEFEAEGDMDLRGFMGAIGVCRHFCSFRGTFTIETTETQERLDQVKEIVENRCPVFNLLHDAGVETNIVWKKK